MQNNKPSRTAKLIFRILTFGASEPKYNSLLDPATKNIILKTASECGYWERVLLFFLRSSIFRLVIFKTADFLTPGFITHVLCRKMAIRSLATKASTNESQLMILGAGYDPLGYLMAAHYDVIEVDHPATSSAKQVLLSSITPFPRLKFIAADLSQKPLITALTESKCFRSDCHHVWLIEGVLMYLTIENINTLFSQISSLSQRGDDVIFTIMKKDRRGSFDFRNQNSIVKQWLKSRQEPFQSGFYPAELEFFLKSHGMQTISFLDTQELRKFLHSDELLAEGECIVHAQISQKN